VARPALRKGLERLRLVEPAFKASERVRAYRARGSRTVGRDGLPLPPPLLMIRVVGHADPDAFEEKGEACAATVRDLVARHGPDIASMESIMDFGCGCGRVLRHWGDLPETRVVGTDYNAQLVAWCSENLPFVEARTNGDRPPLPADDAEFDLVYAFSVFTHLDEPAQRVWMRELQRVLKPTGLLLFTTKGDAHAEQQLDAPDLARYQRGEFVATTVGAQGTNLCAAYSPRAWVERELLRDFELLEHHPGMPAVMDRQEIYLVRQV
jgi:SAM-dependent methyltransferase